MKKLYTQSFFGYCFFVNPSINSCAKIAILTALICACSLAKLSAQNLVLNPSFENTTACPVGISEFDNAIDWYSTNSSYDSCSSPDLYATCAPGFGGANSPNALLGYQPSRTGTHHAGIILGDGFVGCTHFPGSTPYREYIEATFSAPLVAGQRYLVRFYANLPNGAMWGSNTIGAYFTNTQYTHNSCTSGSLINVTPQLNYCGPPIMDTSRWTPVEWIYTAVGGERYMTIGNFKTDANTNFTTLNCNSFNPYIYYFIDDVNVSLVLPNQCGYSVITDSVNATCGNSNGSAIATAIGCSSPFTYAWSTPGGSSPTLPNLGAGTYTVSVTDALGCRQTATVSVNVACATTICRNTSGSITVSGGTAPYTWQTWDSVGRACQGGIVLGGLCLGGSWVTTYGWKTVSTGSATTYTPPAGTDTLRVIDNAGTTVFTSNVATVPPCNACALVVTAGTKRNISCLGLTNGFAKVNTTGGVGTMTYTWSPNVSTVDSASGLAAGTYSVTVRDINNCTGSASFAITQPTSSLSVGLSVNLPAACGANTGKLKVSVTGGTPAYTFTWSPNVSTVDSAINLAAGTYRVTITDQGSCSSVLTGVVVSTPPVTVSAGPQTNVACFGGSTGVAHTTVTGGTAPFTYTWSPAVSTVDSARNLSAGTYAVTVRDFYGCTGTTSFTITQPASGVSAGPTTVAPTCGGSNGRVVLHAAGGTPGYTYTWSPSVSTIDSAINLASGTYNVTITDTRGCTVASSATVATSTGVTVTAGPQTNVSCFAGTNGVAHTNVSGGTAPYTYVWSPNVSTVDSAINLAAGTYSVTVRDINNCAGNTSFTITQPASAVATAPTTVAATCGGANGRVVIHATGGTPSYTYTWSPAASTIDSAINLAGGTYNVTVRDARGCSAVTSATVTTLAGVTVSAGPKTDVSCFGGNNGVAHVIVSGGAAPFVYTWSPTVSSNDSATNLAAGTYTVTVRDANSCTGTASFTIAQPSAALAATNITSPASCGASNGKVVLTVTGGTPGYTYVWSPNVSTTDSAVNVPVGSYTITVTDSKGCILTSTATIISSSGFSVSQGTLVNVNCFGGATGSAHVTVAGGSIPYSYTWSPNVSTADSAINLSAGTYSVTVRDASACSGVVIFNITQPADALSVTAAVTQGSCGNNNGRIILSTTGGTPAYTYMWSPTGNTTDSAVGLSTGTYIATVTDSRGCTASTSNNITISPAVNASMGPQVNVSCFGGSNGVAHVAVSGGTAPFNYLWSNFTTRDSISGVPAGTYYVAVRDANNCLDTVSFVITQPATALSASATAVPATCNINNGKVRITANGGTPLYSYAWSPNVSSVDSATGLAANTYNITVTDANGCTAGASAAVTATPTVTATISATRNITCNGANNGFIRVTAASGTAPYRYAWTGGSTLDSLSGLPQGTYTVSVTDANGCVATASATITEPAALGVTVATTLAQCSTSDGTAAATVTGGTGAMTYLWSAGIATGAADSALAAGSYTLTVTDANLCRVTGAFTINNFNAPTVVVSSATNLVCNGAGTGSIHLTVSGGSPAYTYLWSPAVSTADSAINLAAGSYSVTVRDAGNCIAVTNATLTQPSPFVVTMRSGNADCGVTNGWAEANATGSNGGYTYLWSNTQTVDSIIGLSGGQYLVTITDALGCVHTDAVTVNVNGGPTAPTITASGPVTFCLGDSVVLTSSAATGNTWSNGATTQSITVINGGTFTVTQTAGACTGPPSASLTVTVNPIPSTPAITASGPLTFCPGGSVTLTSSAPSGNTWSNAATSPSITVTTSGNYTVFTTLAGCPGFPSAPVAVTVLPVPTPQITTTATSVCPGGLVTLDATTAGASGYLWSTGSTLPSIPAGDGSYQVTVTVNTCTASAAITIGLDPVLGTVALPDSFAPCAGDTITLDATTDHATAYLWHGITATTPTVLIMSDSASTGSQVYSVDVSNSCGSASDSVMITFQQCDCRMVMANAFTPNGDGKNDLYGPTFLCAVPTSLSLHVYNRWGQKVFDSDELTGKWDGSFKGEQQPADVYIYMVELVGLENHKEKTIRMSGTVTLIR